MTMRSRPRGRGETRETSREAFVKQAAAEETQQLHCLIPESLHHRLRMMAAEGRTTMTALVTEAPNDFVESILMPIRAVQGVD